MGGESRGGGGMERMGVGVKMRCDGGWEDIINVEYYQQNLFSTFSLGESFFLFPRENAL